MRLFSKRKMRKSNELKRSVRTAVIFVFLMAITYLLVANRWTKSIELDSLFASPRLSAKLEIPKLPELQLKKTKIGDDDIPDVEADEGPSDVEDQIVGPQTVTMANINSSVHFQPVVQIANGQLDTDTVTAPSFVMDKETEDKNDLELVSELKQREFETTNRDKSWLAKGQDDTIGALKKSLDYVYNFGETMNVDAYIYLAIVKGRIRLLFRKLVDHKAEFIKDLTPSAVDDLYAILEAVKKVLNSANDVLRASNSFNENLRSLYAADLWEFEINRKYFDVTDNPDPGTISQSPYNVFECISQLIGSGAHSGHPCSVENECWSSMTRNGMGGFGAVQQVFFILIGEAFHCESTMNFKAVANNMQSYTAYLGRFCSSIYKELTAQSEIQMLNKLNFEQVFICGLAGYKEFYRPDVFTNLLNSQTTAGCYEEQTITSVIMKVFINKSSDICSTSKTSSAIAALSGFLIHSIESSNF